MNGSAKGASEAMNGLSSNPGKTISDSESVDGSRLGFAQQCRLRPRKPNPASPNVR